MKEFFKKIFHKVAGFFKRILKTVKLCNPIKSDEQFTEDLNKCESKAEKMFVGFVQGCMISLMVGSPIAFIIIRQCLRL